MMAITLPIWAMVLISLFAILGMICAIIMLSAWLTTEMVDEEDREYPY